MNKKDIMKFREEFPVLSQKMHGKPLIYLDSAATTQKPKRVIEALSSFYCKEYATVHRGVYALSLQATDKYNATRERVQKFICAASMEEIIFTKGTTDAINLVAFSFGEAFIHEGDEIIISEMEHHSNLVPWQMLCQRKKAILKVIPINDSAELILEEYDKLLSEKTKLVCVSHIANATGTINPIHTIIDKAHKKGAKVLIDGAQAVSHMPIDVQSLDVDFYAFSAHKMYGPNGVGILYGKKAVLEIMPPFEGGGDMIEKVTIQKTTYQKPPLRFEAGTPNIADVIAFREAIDFIESIGWDNIKKWEAELLQHATEKMQKIASLQFIGKAKEKSGIISFIIENTHPLDIGTFLDLEGIAVRTGHHCAQPTMQHFAIPGTVRISFGVYNLLEEIDFFVTKLLEIIKKLQI